jgi:hypothetical protein
MVGISHVCAVLGGDLENSLVSHADKGTPINRVIGKYDGVLIDPVLKRLQDLHESHFIILFTFLKNITD